MKYAENEVELLKLLTRIAVSLEELTTCLKEKESNKEKESVRVTERYKKGTTDRGNIHIEKVREVLVQRKVQRVVMERWKATYPVDFIVDQINQAETWIVSNPNREKKNYSRFFSSWLARAWNERGKALRMETGASDGHIENAINKHFEEEQ